MTTPMTHEQLHARLDDARRHGRPALLDGAQLEGADLRGLNLGGAFLQGAHLAGADLEQAYLSGAYLQGADLRGANLKAANLQRANLREANLTGRQPPGCQSPGCPAWQGHVDEYRPAGRELAAGLSRYSAHRPGRPAHDAAGTSGGRPGAITAVAPGADETRPADPPGRRAGRAGDTALSTVNPQAAPPCARYDDGTAERHP